MVYEKSPSGDELKHFIVDYFGEKCIAVIWEDGGTDPFTVLGESS
jgi:hypothetical protein